MLEWTSIHLSSCWLKWKKVVCLLNIFFYDSRQRRQCCWCISFWSALFAKCPMYKTPGINVRCLSMKNTESLSRLRLMAEQTLLWYKRCSEKSAEDNNFNTKIILIAAEDLSGVDFPNIYRLCTYISNTYPKSWELRLRKWFSIGLESTQNNMVHHSAISCWLSTSVVSISSCYYRLWL